MEGAPQVLVYELRFRAAVDQPPDDAAQRLGAALATLTGAHNPLVETDDDPGSLSASFDLTVGAEAGISDAALVGSRFAKEALVSSGLGDSRLLELNVRFARAEDSV